MLPLRSHHHKRCWSKPARGRWHHRQHASNHPIEADMQNHKETPLWPCRFPHQPQGTPILAKNQICDTQNQRFPNFGYEKVTRRTTEAATQSLHKQHKASQCLPPLLFLLSKCCTSLFNLNQLSFSSIRKISRCSSFVVIILGRSGVVMRP